MEPSPAAAVAGERRLEPVTRRYRPQSAPLDDLVEVLYRLLMDVPTNESAAGESTCFPAAPK